jgi:hypothetical protein
MDIREGIVSSPLALLSIIRYAACVEAVGEEEEND